MRPKAVNRWRILAIGLLAVAMIQFVMLIREGGALLQSTPKAAAVVDDGFEAFEGINFAREFSERYQTFEARNFKATQTATAFLLDEESRVARFAEIDRLVEKIVRRDVAQKARLLTLMKLPLDAERFRADLEVELSEGAATASRFTTRLEFSLVRTARSEQNPWGFYVTRLTQAVIQPLATDGASGDGASGDGVASAPVFALRAGVAMLVRFPCSIENVELPKATSIRVKLTTLDISELQLKSLEPLSAAQTVRAVCRDRAFTMALVPEQPGDVAKQPLVVLKSLSLASSKPSAVVRKKPKHRRTDVEKSIEEQLGFVVEEE